MRDRIASLFARKQHTNETEIAEAPVIDEATIADAPVIDESLIDQDVEPSAVTPPDDFKFPWTRPEGDPSAEPLPEPIPPLDTEADSFEAQAEPLADSQPEPARPGFFARLFGRKTKDVPPKTTSEIEIERAAESDDAPVVAEAIEVEADIELRSYDAPVEQPLVELPTFEPPAEQSLDELPTFEPLAEQSLGEVPAYEPPSEPQPQFGEDAFASVEDALPAADDAFYIPPPEDIPVEPAKPGILSRLFRRGSKETRRPSLEIEVHEDRIEAAAQALDEVGEEQFESFEGKSSVAEETFESVEEALPSPSLEGLPMIEEFAPTESDRATADADVVDDLPALPTADRAPAEVNIVDDLPAIGERTTAEVDLADIPLLEPVAEAEADVQAAARAPFDGESTLEIDEKTDEFEVVLPPGDEKLDTLQVEKKSFWTRSFVGRLFRRGDTEVEKIGAKEIEAAEEKQAVFLLAKFRAFYNEIIRFQHQKSEFTAGFATAIVTEYAADLSPDAAAEGLSKRLSELLELQAAEAKWMGGEAAERYPDAQYAMAALADETFEYMEWEGRPAWTKFSLERKIYQTNASDVELFRRIDKLLKESPDSVVARDLARVYLLVLAAGFQGKWRPFELERPVAEYRRRLYEYIHNDDALMLYAPERKIFPDASSRTLEGAAVSRFSAAQRWAAILIFLVISYTVIAHIAWNRVSADLKDVTARIKTSPAGVR